MRIAIVSHHFTPYIGGLETQNRVIGEALVHRGHDVTVLTRRYDPVLPSNENRDGIRIERLWPGGQGVLAKWLMNTALFYRMAVGRPSFDAALITQPSAHVLGPALAGVFRRLPLVLRPDETGELSGAISSESLSRLPWGIRFAARGMVDAARNWAYRRSHRVVAISSGLAREAETVGFPPSSVVLIPNGIDTKRFRPVRQDEKATLRESLGIPPEAEVVAWVGRLVRRKGLLTLLEAWKGIVRDRPRAMLMILGGGPGPRSPHDAELSLRESIESAGLRDRVLLTGPIEDVERYLQAGDLYVSTSEQEGFGLALVEAMACGLPVICTRIEGAATDLVVDGEHGLKFDVGDAAGLRARITKLLDNEMMRTQMGAAGHALVHGKLGIDRIAEAYEKVFLNVSNKPNPMILHPDREKAGNHGANS